MVDDPDAIWKPGYDGPSPTVESDTDALDDPSPELLSEPESPARPARSRWWLGVGVIIVGALALGVAVVVLDPIGAGGEPDQDDTEDASVFGAPDDRRLPQSATELWSVDIELTDDDIDDDIGDHWIEVIRRDLVVAAVAGTASSTVASPATTLVAFDALTGERRWMFPLDARPNDVAVVGRLKELASETDVLPQ